MKKVMFGFIACALVAASAFATPTVQLYQQTGYSYSNGGEFTAKPSGWNWDPLVYYSDNTKNRGTRSITLPSRHSAWKQVSTSAQVPTTM